MGKTVNIRLGSETFSLALTFGAFEELTEEFGNIENIYAALFEGDIAEFSGNMIRVLHVLLKGGRAYVKLTEGIEERAVSEDELRIICDVPKISEYRHKILDTFLAGLERTVEIEQDEKNE